MQFSWTSHERYTIVVLCFINVTIYIDRYSVLSMADYLCKNYDVDNDFGNQLFPVFYAPYILMAPIFGYLGDRFRRQKIMIISILLWSISTLVSTIAPTSTVFLKTRMCAGAFQAGFCVIAPSVLADIVRDAELSKILEYFNIMIPVGRGIGFIVTGILTTAIGHWFSLLFAALIAFTGGIFLFFALEPKRGFKDTLALGKGKRLRATPYKQDLLSLMHNKSFIFVSLALACYYFMSGVMSKFGTELLILGYEIIQLDRELVVAPKINVKVGAVVIISGIIGVSLGSMLSRLLRPIMSRVDTIICGWGLVMSFPIVTLAILTSSIRISETYYYMLFGYIGSDITWAVSYDILLYIVIPTRRCSVFGWHTFISHSLGELISTGVIKQLRNYFYTFDFTEIIEAHDVEDLDVTKFYTLRNGMLSVMGVQLLGGILFLLNAFFILKAVDEAKKETLLLTYHNKVPNVKTLDT